jgi:hypothetical protein
VIIDHPEESQRAIAEDQGGTASSNIPEGLRPEARGCKGTELPRVTPRRITYLAEVVAVNVPLQP